MWQNNQDKLAASFCHQVAGWFSGIIGNIYLAKNHNFANNSTTAKAEEKISTDLESLEFLEFLD